MTSGTAIHEAHGAAWRDRRPSRVDRWTDPRDPDKDTAGAATSPVVDPLSNPTRCLRCGVLSPRSLTSRRRRLCPRGEETVNARVAGQVVEIAVKDNQRVKQGQLLFQIDPQPYRIAVEQAEARLDSLRLQVDELEGHLSPAIGRAAIGDRHRELRRA